MIFPHKIDISVNVEVMAKQFLGKKTPKHHPTVVNEQ